jgi:hypothetical protein
MFASLRNKFSNYRTHSLRFDIEENIIIEPFASLRFASITLKFAFNVFERVYTIENSAVPGGVYTTWARDANGRVCSTEECTAPGGVYTIGA